VQTCLKADRRVSSVCQLNSACVTTWLSGAVRLEKYEDRIRDFSASWRQLFGFLDFGSIDEFEAKYRGIIQSVYIFYFIYFYCLLAVNVALRMDYFPTQDVLNMYISGQTQSDIFVSYLRVTYFQFHFTVSLSTFCLFL